MTVYLRPEVVAEIAFSDLPESPRDLAGRALRFARVMWYRPDKAASEADTIQTVMEIFRQQRVCAHAARDNVSGAGGTAPRRAGRSGCASSPTPSRRAPPLPRAGSPSRAGTR